MTRVTAILVDRGCVVILSCALVLPGVMATDAEAQIPPNTPQNEGTQPDLINPDRPGIADGSMTIGHHAFQIESALQQEFHRDQSTRERLEFIPTLFRIGINDAWEARIEGNGYVWSRADAAGDVVHTRGYAPVSIGFKYHWQDMEAKRPSLGAIGRVFVPSGSQDFRSQRVQGDLRLVADENLTDDGTWELNVNVGIAAYDDGQAGVFKAGLFAATLNYVSRSKRINPFVDIGLQAPEETRGRTAATIDAGIAWIAHPNAQIDLSAGTRALGRTPPRLFWALGLSIRR